ncbi:MAG TPA: formyltransferase family protein, partial [Pirellulales bacterium]
MQYSLGQPVSPLRLVVLISGGGTTLKNLIQKIAVGKLNAKIEQVISSTAKAGGLRIAEAAGIPTIVVDPKNSPTPAEFSEATFNPCREAGAHIVVMAG